MSERRACGLIGVHRSTARYEAHARDDAPLRQQIRAMAMERRRFGYRRLTEMIGRRGQRVNHKRVYRIYCEEALSLRRRRRKRMAGRSRPASFVAPTRPNQRWSMDFMSDTLRLADGSAR
jgi:putative transposase